MQQGLAESMAQPEGMQQAQQPAAAGGMPTVEEVVAMLMEGAPPEELEKMGIPRELIIQAIQMLEQQMAQQEQQQQQPMGGGLAQQVVGG
jgi:hypothetical protein